MMRNVTPPFRPNLKSKIDTRMFDSYYIDQPNPDESFRRDTCVTAKKGRKLNEIVIDFPQFEFNCRVQKSDNFSSSASMMRCST